MIFEGASEHLWTVSVSLSCNFQLSTEHICVQRRSSPHPAWLSWLASSWTSPLAAAKVHLLRNFGLRHATPKCHNPLRSHPNPACVQCGHLAFIQNHSMTKLYKTYITVTYRRFDRSRVTCDHTNTFLELSKGMGLDRSLGQKPWWEPREMEHPMGALLLNQPNRGNKLGNKLEDWLESKDIMPEPLQVEQLKENPKRWKLSLSPLTTQGGWVWVKNLQGENPNKSCSQNGKRKRWWSHPIW